MGRGLSRYSCARAVYVKERPPLQKDGCTLSATSGLRTSFALQLGKESDLIWHGPLSAQHQEVRARKKKLLT